MSDQNPLDTRMLTRIGLAGIALAVVGVVLFILVWNTLGRADVADFPRLFAAICIPPAGIAGIMGIYLLIARPYDDSR